MRAKVIKEMVCDGILNYTHGQTFPILRLVVEQANNLAITPYKDEVYAFHLESREYEVLGETEVSKELVEKALAFICAKKKFYELKPQFEKLLSPY
ncbi:MAG: hypothetical protein V1910_02195 [bacterium]